MPDFRAYAKGVDKPARSSAMNTKPARAMLPTSCATTDQLPRVRAGRDHVEQARRDLRGDEEALLAEYRPEDMDGRARADGRVMEMLSEHTLEGWYEGYVLTGRHGFFAPTRPSST